MSVVKVVATIEMPISHHGAARPAAKNSVMFSPGAPRQYDRRHEAHSQGNDDDDPIERPQVHGTSAFGSACEMTSAGASVSSLGSSP